MGLEKSCPAAPLALVIFWVGAAAVIVAAGRGGGAETGAGLSVGREHAGAPVWDWGWDGAGAGTRGGAGTEGGQRAGDGTGAAATWRADLLWKVLRRGLELIRAFWSVVEAEDPAEPHAEKIAQARGEVQDSQGVWGGWELLAQPGAAEVLQGSWSIASTDDLHAALGCCGAHHRVELLILQPGGGHT